METAGYLTGPGGCQVLNLLLQTAGFWCWASRKPARLPWLTADSGTVLSHLAGEASLLGCPLPLRKEFYRAIPVDQLKAVFHSDEISRRCLQGLGNRGVATFMRLVRLSLCTQFPANEEK